MASERKEWITAGFCTVAVVMSVLWIANGGGRDPGVTPAPSVPVTLAPSTPAGSASRSATLGTQELPDCGYRLPPCVRQQDGQWFLINDYQGDQRPVSLVTSVVRGDVVYRIVKG